MSIIILFFFGQKEFTTNPEIIIHTIKHIFLLSAIGIFFKISYKKYNFEGNLHVIYDHRATTLDIYEIFEKAIDKDAEAKKQLRLEIVRNIFSDPQTGFVKDPKSSDVNVNPIFTLMEKMSR